MFEGECLRVELKEGRGVGSVLPKDFNRTANCVVVNGLPHSTSWQDLKDHMRQAGDVAFVEIERPGVGIVRYNGYSDVRIAVKTLDRSIFRDSHGDKEIRVRFAEDDRADSTRSRSRRR